MHFTKGMLLLLLLSHFSRVWLCVTPSTAATRLPRPWDTPSKNTGVGCHFLLQCRKVKSESEVAQSCPTLSDPTDYTAHQAPSSMGFSRQSTGVGCHCLLRTKGIKEDKNSRWSNRNFRINFWVLLILLHMEVQNTTFPGIPIKSKNIWWPCCIKSKLTHLTCRPSVIQLCPPSPAFCPVTPHHLPTPPFFTALSAVSPASEILSVLLIWSLSPGPQMPYLTCQESLLQSPPLSQAFHDFTCSFSSLKHLTLPCLIPGSFLRPQLSVCKPLGPWCLSSYVSHTASDRAEWSTVSQR